MERFKGRRVRELIFALEITTLIALTFLVGVLFWMLAEAVA